MHKYVQFVLDSFIGASSISSQENFVLTMSCGCSHLELHLYYQQNKYGMSIKTLKEACFRTIPNKNFPPILLFIHVNCIPHCTIYLVDIKKKF